MSPFYMEGDRKMNRVPLILPPKVGNKYMLQAVDFRKERITLTSTGASRKSVKMSLDQIGKDRLGV